MPLVGGYSQEAISRRIAQLIEEGVPQKQAVAISYSEARRAAKRIRDKNKREAILRRLRRKGG